MLGLESHQDTLALLRYQTNNYFLCNILSRVVKEFFKLETCEFVYNLVFSSDRYRVLRFKLIQFILLFEHVFDEPPPAVSHLT